MEAVFIEEDFEEEDDVLMEALLLGEDADYNEVGDLRRNTTTRKPSWRYQHES